MVTMINPMISTDSSSLLKSSSSANCDPGAERLMREKCGRVRSTDAVDMAAHNVLMLLLVLRGLFLVLSMLLVRRCCRHCGPGSREQPQPHRRGRERRRLFLSARQVVLLLSRMMILC